jgi:hypothetical protein
VNISDYFAYVLFLIHWRCSIKWLGEPSSLTMQQSKCDICWDSGHSEQLHSKENTAFRTPGQKFCHFCWKDPNRARDHTTNDHLCSYCGEKGTHTAKNHLYHGTSDTKTDRCSTCGKMGHTIGEHVNGMNGRCRICGAIGHYSSEHSPSCSGFRDRPFCVICTTFGHTTDEHVCGKCGEKGTHRAQQHD